MGKIFLYRPKWDTNVGQHLPLAFRSAQIPSRSRPRIPSGMRGQGLETIPESSIMQSWSLDLASSPACAKKGAAAALAGGEIVRAVPDGAVIPPWPVQGGRN